MTPGIGPARNRARFEEWVREEPDVLLAGLTTASGADFLAWLVTFLQKKLDVSFAFVGELCGEDWDRVRTVAVASAEGIQDNFDYDLAGTPCANVTSQHICHHADAVADEFPEDSLLRDMEVESYMGIPLTDPSGRSLGLMVVLDRKPMSDEAIPLLQDALRLFRPRVQAELTRQRALRELEQLGQGLALDMDGAATRGLVKYLAHTANVKVAFVSVAVGGAAGRMRTAGLSIGGRLVEDMEYDPAGTACERVQEEGMVFIPSRVREAFPDDHFLQELNAEAYLGIAFPRLDGVPTGHIGIIHDRPLQESFCHNSLLRLLAQRAAVEAGRRVQEERRLELERQFVNLQRTESLGMLAGGVAHDFNNLLTGILGNIEMARARLIGQVEATDLLARAETASQNAARLCRQLLAYAGKGHQHPQPLALDSVVRETLSLLTVSVPEDHQLRMRLADSLPAILADRPQTQQIVMNLVINALDALARGPGEIVLTSGVRACGRAELDRMTFGHGRPAGDYVFLTVADTGQGMDAEQRRKMFEPFYSTREAGHGLGLAAVSGIIRRHDGAVDVVSAPGKGTSVTVFFPAHPELTVQPAGGRPAGAAPRLRARILVVDDQEGVREIVRQMLENEGAAVSVAAGGAEAIEVLAAAPDDIDCVVLDLAMPGMSGEETLRQMRQIRPSVPVLIASGYDAEDVIGRLAAAGPLAWIPKPFRRHELTEAIRTILGDPPGARATTI
ncbi:MAG: response regulator [Acidobacteriota bacterium]